MLTHTKRLITTLLIFGCGELPPEHETDSPVRNGIESLDSYRTVGLILDVGRGSICSGVLLNSSVVLTAAHCVSGANAGDLLFTNQIPYVWNPASDFAAHPTYQEIAGSIPIQENGFDTVSVSNLGVDLALIKLEHRYTGLTYDALDTTFPSTSMTIVGWGIDESNDNAGIRRRGVVNVIGRAAVPSTLAGDYLADRLLISHSTAAGQEICPGDSGGPAYRISGTTRLITGIASSVLSADSGAPCTSVIEGFHASISPNRAWIDSTRIRLDPPGRCTGDDDALFATLNGGCTSRSTGLTFSRRSSTAMSRNAARNYCNNLVEGGRGPVPYARGWRLPSTNELLLTAPEHAGHLTSAGTSRFWSNDEISSAAGQAVRLSDGTVTQPALATQLFVFCVGT